MTGPEWHEAVALICELWPRSDLGAAQIAVWREALGDRPLRDVAGALRMAYGEGKYATPRLQEVKRHLPRGVTCGVEHEAPSWEAANRWRVAVANPMRADEINRLSDRDMRACLLCWEYRQPTYK